MTTPIVDFVKKYAADAGARFHMPGHKGTPLLGCEALDITEIRGADDLFSPEGIIAESERNAAALFGAGQTLYSAEGATLAIKAMLALAAQKHRQNGARVRILAARNAHKSFLYGCALLDIDVDWLYGEGGHLCECRLSKEALEQALSAPDADYCAVYVTSPDYLGNMLNIAALSAVCRIYGVPLLVDNAHGAYLAFTGALAHPMALGAAMCADSAHKTLPALTGTAYLHIAPDADPYFAAHAREAMALFASSSPSYLLLQSLDLCNAQLEKEFPTAYAAQAQQAFAIKEKLLAAGYELIGQEPLKLTISGNARGYTGEALAAVLRAARVEPEYVDADHVVLMCSPANHPTQLAQLCKLLTALPAQEKLPKTHTVMPLKAKKACSVREAILSPSERVPVCKARGRICASPTVSCPPAIPILISGEQIDEQAIALLNAYGVKEICVVK